VSRLFPGAVIPVLVAGALVAMAPVAEAGYTAVKQPRRRSEVSHERIIEHVYGGNFVADVTGLSFSNESGVTVTRLEDGVGAATDESWSGKRISARAVAAFSGKRRTAGYFGANVGGQVQRLFETSGRQFNVSGAAESAAVVDGDLVLGQGRDRRARTFSSNSTTNSDGMDHLVTYEITGQPASVYLLCWEDKFARRSDRDYNDLVVEVQAAEAAARAPMSQPLLIPLPPDAWPGLAGLPGVGFMTPRRRRRTARRVPIARGAAPASGPH
jgi:hypothetical protein